MTYDSFANERTYEIAGVYGEPLANNLGTGVYASATEWAIEGLHGLEPDRDNGLMHAGARHFLMRDGVWLQPEPLLALGIQNGNLTVPLGFGPAYSAGNTAAFGDRGGHALAPAFMAQMAKAYVRFEATLAAADWAAAGASIATAVVAPTASNIGNAVVDTAAAAAGGVLPGGGVASGRVAATAADTAAGVLKSGACFVAGTTVLTGREPRPIEMIRVNDRVVASSYDSDAEPWVEVRAAPGASSDLPPGGICDRLKRWASVVAVPAAMLAACDVAELPAADEAVRIYDTRDWRLGRGGGAELEVGDTYLDDGRVLRVVEDGVEVRGDAAAEVLAEADATWIAEAAHRVPGGEDWVLVLGNADDAGHWRLADVKPGERFAFQGRVFETGDQDTDGDLEVRATGDVLGPVVDTFVRVSPEVIDAEITYADGTTDTLTGTPNHPFWVDAVRDYVPLGELAVGTTLHVQGGGEAILVSKTWRQGDFEVFDFEVAGLHNFYVRGPGSDAAGVLVHNSTASKAASSVDDLSRAAGAADKADLTKAGRAVQKQGDRPGSAFPKATGAPADKNALGFGARSAWRAEVVPDREAAAQRRAAEEAKREARKLVRLERRSRRSRWWPWADLLERVFGVDGWSCPCCGGPMRLRAVVVGAPATTRVWQGLTVSSRGPPP